ncbi:hypothetical protein ACFL6S_20075 [Candidatus Poribacteria bacterium]
MPKNYLFVAIYNTLPGGEAAIRDIQDSGIDMMRLSFLGRDYRARDKLVGRYQSSDHTRYWENLGTFGDGVWGLLSSIALFHIPETGPFLAGGPVAGAMIGALEGSPTVRGLSAVGSGLHIIGIPRDSVLKYERAIKDDKYLIIAQGVEEEIAAIKAIIKNNGAVEFDLHQK